MRVGLIRVILIACWESDSAWPLFLIARGLSPLYCARVGENYSRTVLSGVLIDPLEEPPTTRMYRNYQVQSIWVSNLSKQLTFSLAVKDLEDYTSTSAMDNHCWKNRKSFVEGCIAFSVAFWLNKSQRTPPSDINIISYRPHKSNTRNRRSGFIMVICWKIFKTTRNF